MQRPGDKWPDNLSDTISGRHRRDHIEFYPLIQPSGFRERNGNGAHKGKTDQQRAEQASEERLAESRQYHARRLYQQIGGQRPAEAQFDHQFVPDKA